MWITCDTIQYWFYILKWKNSCEEAVQIFDLEDYEKMIAILNNLERDENKSKAAQKVVFDYLNATRMAKEYEHVYSED